MTSPKTIGVVGLGRMGGGVAGRLLRAGFAVHGYDPVLPSVLPDGLVLAGSLQQLAQEAEVILLFVPAGRVVDMLLSELQEACLASSGPVYVVDCGNSFYGDTTRRAQSLSGTPLVLVDAGVSGGVLGAQNGYCIMVGGPAEAFKHIEPVLKAIAAPDGCLYVGLIGAGHYVKMVHNAIEYGLMQSYAEGFHLLRQGQYENLDTAALARLWQQGSIIESKLLGLLAGILQQPEMVEAVSGVVAENGTGRWGLEEARRQQVPFDCIEKALALREWSRQSGGNYATTLVALLRQAFGGHSVAQKTGKENV